MKNDHSFKVVAAVILTGVFLALFTPARAADDTTPPKTPAKTRSGTYQSSNGNSGTVNSTITRGAGTRTRLSTVTNQNGQTANQSATRTWNRAAGTGTVSSSTTGFNGNTSSRQGTLTKNADGSVSGQGTITGPQGKTSTYANNTVRTATGSSTTGTITGPNGQTVDKNVTNTFGPGGTDTRVVDITKPNGTTTSRTTTYVETDAPSTTPKP